jgi:hypothetical protein
VTPVIPDGLEPLAVWDLKGEQPAGWVTGYATQALLWLMDHVPEEHADLSRAEFYLFDGPFAVVGAQSPVIVPLAELPPAHLLGMP